MVRIAYRTSSGIYGPKDATFPKVIRDAEMQLKRCRLREHSLRKCISILLVVVAFCMCGLIVGLVSTCQTEDDQEENKEASDFIPVLTDNIEPTRESTGHSDTSDETVFSTEPTSTASDLVTPQMTESNNVTAEDTENTSYPSTETTSFFDLSEHTSHETHETENSAEETTTQEINLTFVDSTSHGYNDSSSSQFLSNILERLHSSVPPLSKVKLTSFAEEAASSSTSSGQEEPLHFEVKIPDTTGSVGLMPTDVDKSPKLAKDISAETIATLPKSDPIVKVSFITPQPICCD